jgi:hypothetical protein
MGRHCGETKKCVLYWQGISALAATASCNSYFDGCMLPAKKDIGRDSWTLSADFRTLGPVEVGLLRDGASPKDQDGGSYLDIIGYSQVITTPMIPAL